MKMIPETSLPVLTPARLRRMAKGKDRMTDRQIAALYGVANQKYICDLRHGVEPTRTTEKGREARYRMGLDRRPVVKAAREPTVLQMIIERMAAETRKALKGWRPSTKFVKKGQEI